MKCVSTACYRGRNLRAFLIPLLLLLCFSPLFCRAQVLEESLQKEIQKHYSSLVNSDNEAELTRACISLIKLGPKAKHLIPDLFNLIEECSSFKSIYPSWVLQAVSKGSEREIIKYLDDSDPNVQSSALLCLRRPNVLPPEVLLPRLLPFLEKGSWQLAEALIVLERMGRDAKPALEVLVKILRSDDILNRSSIPAILRNIGVPNESVLSSLREALTSPDTVLQIEAAVSLQALCPEKDDGIQRLIMLLSDSDKNVRWKAARGLGRIGVRSDFVQKKLETALKDSKIQVRVWANFALYRINTINAIYLDALLIYSKSKDTIVQGSAMMALSEVGPEAKRALPQIIDLLNNENPGVQISVIVTLAKFGAIAEPALPALRAKLNINNGIVAVMVLHTIETIESEIRKNAEEKKDTLKGS